MNLSFVLCVSLQSANVFLEIEGQIQSYATQESIGI